ncbi:unnamed protein product [Mycena citricolor]|uniref:Ketoreductase domain-containing protein n=1 Tax=Mycena citricolor TaxID=2018698 RepID=A0AAD2H8X1_9AGAR|nr:unnamed protein product [Mycena citricolor]
MQVVLITGCSSGLGRELALAALNAGMRVIATARRIDTLSDLASRGAKVLPLDTTASPRDLAQFVELAIGQYGQIHCLINNAGYLQGGALEEIGHAANMAQFDTNFFGVLNLTHALLPHFRSLPPKTCAIVNISSQGAILNLAGAGIYCASKAALDSVTAVWAKELQPWGVRCTAIHLGGFRTAVGTSANVKTGSRTIEGYDAAHDWMESFRAGAGKEPGDPVLAARKIIDLIGGDKGREWPHTLALGDDAYQNDKAFYESSLKKVEDWKEFSKGTDFQT